MQASINDYLAIDTKEVLKRQLRSSYIRTALALGGLGLTAYFAYSAARREDAGAAILAVILAIFAFLMLIGYTPRRGFILPALLGPSRYWPSSTIHDSTAKAARVAAAKSAIRTGEGLDAGAFVMRRRLKILMLSRLLGAVLMAMIWVAFYGYSQHMQRTAHFERFGTYDGVSVLVHLDGTETITIDPSLDPGSYRETHEQPPRPFPVAPTVQAAPDAQTAPAPTEQQAPPKDTPSADPVLDPVPIVAPNPPLPSFWPPITPGYSVTIYERTASGGLKAVEVRLQYAQGAMHAVGP